MWEGVCLSITTSLTRMHHLSQYLKIIKKHFLKFDVFRLKINNSVKTTKFWRKKVWTNNKDKMLSAVFSGRWLGNVKVMEIAVSNFPLQCRNTSEKYKTAYKKTQSEKKKKKVVRKMMQYSKCIFQKYLKNSYRF